MPEGSHGMHVPAGDGEAWWFMASRMTYLVDAERSGGRLTLALRESAAGFGPPRHVHESEDEAFFVLDGAIHIVCGEQTWEAGPGSFTWLPRAVPHTFIVTKPARMLQLTTPGGFEKLVTEMGQRADGPGLPPPEVPDIPELSSISARHWNTIVGPPLDPADFGITR
jgi:mannose-6-phosphate isomerase-like protein (cupin superfamily)